MKRVFNFNAISKIIILSSCSTVLFAQSSGRALCDYQKPSNCMFETGKSFTLEDRFEEYLIIDGKYKVYFKRSYLHRGGGITDYYYENEGYIYMYDDESAFETEDGYYVYVQKK